MASADIGDHRGGRSALPAEMWYDVGWALAEYVGVHQVIGSQGTEVEGGTRARVDLRQKGQQRTTLEHKDGINQVNK